MAWACLFPDRKAFVQHVWGQASRSILVVFCQGQSTSHLKTPFLQRNRPSLIVGLQHDERWWLEGHAHQIMDGRWCSTQIAWVLVSKTFQRRRITSQSDWKCSVSPNGALRLPNVGGNVVKRFFTMGSCKILIHYFRFPNLKLDWPWWRFQRGHMSCNKCGWGVKIGIAWWCPCYWHVMLPIGLVSKKKQVCPALHASAQWFVSNPCVASAWHWWALLVFWKWCDDLLFRMFSFYLQSLEFSEACMGPKH